MKDKKIMDTFEILALHKYFVNANYMRTLFYECLDKRDKKIKATDDPELMSLTSLWYGCLYVVAEGWADLKLADKKIDVLLQSNFLSDLKGFRHDVFHFQKKYYATRSVKFMSTSGAAKWVRDLNREFGRYFILYFDQIKRTSNENL